MTLSVDGRYANQDRYGNKSFDSSFISPSINSINSNRLGGKSKKRKVKKYKRTN